MLEVESLPLSLREIGRRVDGGSVVGMCSLQDALERRWSCAIEVEDAVRFLRPVDLSARQVPAEVAGVAQPLRLGQADLAPPEFLLPVRALGDVNAITDVTQKVAA